jgi:hypothetical protein
LSSGFDERCGAPGETRQTRASRVPTPATASSVPGTLRRLRVMNQQDLLTRHFERLPFHRIVQHPDVVHILLGKT